MSTSIDERLQLLDAHYVRRISAAVDADRMDLVRDLANDYHDEALALILAAEGSTSSQYELGNRRDPRAGRVATFGKCRQAGRVVVPILAAEQPLGSENPRRITDLLTIMYRHELLREQVLDITELKCQTAASRKPFESVSREPDGPFTVYSGKRK